MTDSVRPLNENYVEDISTGVILPTRRTRRNVVIATLLFSWAVIAWIVTKGDPANSLHQSALAWSYATFVGVIFAYVFGAVADNWSLLKVGLGDFMKNRMVAGQSKTSN